MASTGTGLLSINEVSQLKGAVIIPPIINDRSNINVINLFSRKYRIVLLSI
jgi:hypothetical protein